MYLETSTWNFLLADDAPDKKLITERFFRRASKESVEYFISPLVLIEFAATRNEERRLKLFSLIPVHRPQELAVTPEVEQLAERYVVQATIPRRYADDATHVAVSVINHMDAVVSWNLKHLVKLKTRREVNALNKLNGYPEIDIVTPEEVF